MIERATLKSNAKQQLKGKWGLAIGSMFVAGLVTGVFSIGSTILENRAENISMILSLATLFLSGVMSFGMAKFSLNLSKDKESAQFSDIFSGFSIYLKTLGLFILITICVALGIILLIIPGIIIALMFSQAYLVLADNPEKGIIECLKESATMMKGHKAEYFVLQLSFIGWGILAVITLCIGLLWLVPYQQITYANYYLALKEGKAKSDRLPNL